MGLKNEHFLLQKLNTRVIDAYNKTLDAFEHINTKTGVLLEIGL